VKIQVVGDGTNIWWKSKWIMQVDDDNGSVWERGANHVPSKFDFFLK